jgi:hypothetical protein
MEMLDGGGGGWREGEEGEMTDMENRIYLFKLWPRVCLGL